VVSERSDPKVLPIASACTGSNITRVALEALIQKLGLTDSVSIVEKFLCEKVRSKVDFCRWVSKHCSKDDSQMHVYSDIADLCMGVAQCIAHNQPCEIPSRGSQARRDFFRIMWSGRNVAPVCKHVR
jgi:hypothetical protein